MLISALSQQLQPLIDKFKNAKEITGVTAGGKSFLLACLYHYFGKNICFITSTEEKAVQFSDEVKLFLSKNDDIHPVRNDSFSNGVYTFYEKEEFENQRLGVLDCLTKNKDRNNLVITSIKAVLQKTFSKKEFDKNRIFLKRGDACNLEELIKRLIDFGYEKNYLVSSRGEYSNRGYILDIFPSNYNPVRIEFLYDAVEAVKTFDIVSQRSTSVINEVTILPFKETQNSANIIDYLPKDALIILDEPATLKLHVLEYLDELNIKDFDTSDIIKNRSSLVLSHSSERTDSSVCVLRFSDIYSFAGKMPQVYETLRNWQKENKCAVIVSSQYKRLKDILAKENIPSLYYEAPPQAREKQTILIEGKLRGGFMFNDINLAVVSDTELFSSFYRPHEPTIVPQKIKTLKSEIKPGGFVVHKTHGICKFLRLNCIEVAGSRKDYLVLEFDKQALLYHPFDQMDMLEKYIAPEDSQVKLSRLGTSLWKKTQARIKESIKETAQQLLTLYAQREQSKGYSYPADTVWQSELEAAFPFEETPDQLEAIKRVKEDMETDRPTDRLICGDAGFGKTEVALRAAFKAVQDGRQVAVLVPTTILAQQHYSTFSERLSTYPVRVEMLSRFRTEGEQKKIIKKLALGEVDIIIGTHRLLQKDVKFRSLGFLVIDEEQHFGVKHKEYLKELKKNIDCITLTATPIPRTFQMAISGIKNLSIINTPPEHRLPVKTFLFEYNKDIVKGAVLRELERGGQVFYLNNRVRGIDKEAYIIQKLVPNARIAIAHGQMREDELEQIMYDFTDHKYDVLVCTTIIESGLDIPEANTIIVNNAQNFGLSQLYQIRGRVGRRTWQSFAYFLYPKESILSTNALKRLETLKEFSDLGSGFQIAMKDLEIRGAGNLLGTSQHGFIEAVGFNEYCRLIREAVSELRGEAVEQEAPSPAIDIPLQAFIPEEYIADKEVKLDYYKRLAAFTKLEQLNEVKKEFVDLFGKYPLEIENLFIVIALRILAINHKITKIKMEGNALNIIGLRLPGAPVKLLYSLSNQYNVKIYLRDKDLIVEGIASRANWLNVLGDILDKTAGYRI